jgi:hypothetical protein
MLKHGEKVLSEDKEVNADWIAKRFMQRLWCNSCSMHIYF